ncbi:MAG: PKD domain-containing protein, partial [Candidatus Thermoplasmatota archaeon]|nr:PKD domain-containing protein [Candidatus Thermoplasmatota archaeon]
AKMSGLGYYMAIRTFTYDLSVPLNGLEPIHYRIVLTDQAGNSVECDGTVMVKDSIGPVADAGTDIVVKQGTTVVLNGSMSTDNIGITNWTWRWEEGPEEVVLEGMQVSFRFDREGTYIVTLTVRDGSGNVGLDTITVAVEGSNEKGSSYMVYILLALMLVLFVSIMSYFLVIKRKKPEGNEKDIKISCKEP